MFYDIFKKLSNDCGTTPTQVGRELGIKQQTIAMWKKRGTVPNAKIITQLSEYFGVSISYLLDQPEEVQYNPRLPAAAVYGYFDTLDSYSRLIQAMIQCFAGETLDTTNKKNLIDAVQKFDLLLETDNFWATFTLISGSFDEQEPNHADWKQCYKKIQNFRTVQREVHSFLVEQGLIQRSIHVKVPPSYLFDNAAPTEDNQ